MSVHLLARCCSSYHTLLNVSIRLEPKHQDKTWKKKERERERERKREREKEKKKERDKEKESDKERETRQCQKGATKEHHSRKKRNTFPLKRWNRKKREKGKIRLLFCRLCQSVVPVWAVSTIALGTSMFAHFFVGSTGLVRLKMKRSTVGSVRFHMFW